MATVEPLTITDIPIDKIVPNAWNPNRQSDTVARAHKESIERFGFLEPVLVRPHPDQHGMYEIVNGEHRWNQMRAAGAFEIPAIVRELSDDDVKKLTIVLNETTGDPDQLLLAELLSDLSRLDDFKVALPYTDRELEKLLAFGAPEPPATDPPPPDDDDPVEHEIKLTYSPGRHGDVKGWLKILRKTYGINDVSDCVYEALRRSALQANQGDPPAPA